MRLIYLERQVCGNHPSTKRDRVTPFSAKLPWNSLSKLFDGLDELNSHDLVARSNWHLLFVSLRARWNQRASFTNYINVHDASTRGLSPGSNPQSLERTRRSFELLEIEERETFMVPPFGLVGNIEGSPLTIRSLEIHPSVHPCLITRTRRGYTCTRMYVSIEG